MNYLVFAHTDIGIKKNTNQDSVLIHTAKTVAGDVMLCAMCDGMGGLAKGEVASATLVRAFSEWFTGELPGLLKDFSDTRLYASWDLLIQNQGRKIMNYGLDHHVNMGTTVAALLIVGNTYYIVNVGDSRVYELKDNLKQLTKDQTFIQQEIDEGRLRPEDAESHPQRNVLLQCVGASNVIRPVFSSGAVQTDTIYMLCSDGFRHVISPEEIFTHFNPTVLVSEQEMKQKAVYLTDLNKSRHEVDNISVALIRTCQEGANA